MRYMNWFRLHRHEALDNQLPFLRYEKGSACSKGTWEKEAESAEDGVLCDPGIGIALCGSSHPWPGRAILDISGFYNDGTLHRSNIPVALCVVRVFLRHHRADLRQ